MQRQACRLGHAWAVGGGVDKSEGMKAGRQRRAEESDANRSARPLRERKDGRRSSSSVAGGRHAVGGGVSIGGGGRWWWRRRRREGGEQQWGASGQQQRCSPGEPGQLVCFASEGRFQVAPDVSRDGERGSNGRPRARPPASPYTRHSLIKCPK